MTDYIRTMPQRTAFGLALCDIAKENEKLVVLDADVGPSTQTSLFAREYPERFFQCGIAEQNMLGLAAGLSTQGWVPFVSAFAVFLAHRAGDQIRNAIAHPRANVKINGSYAGLPTGRAGATHSCFEDVAVMRALPGMTIFDPADAQETMLLARLAVEMEGPVYLRSVRCDVPPVFGAGHRVAPGKAVQLKDGDDAAVISSGMMTARALEAVNQLERQGIHARLTHMPTLKPLDEEAVLAAARTGLIVTVENHSVIGGLGSAVCEAAARSLPCRVERCGYQDLFLESGDDEVLFHRYGLSASAIARRIREALGA
jgi:transketolase